MVSTDYSNRLRQIADVADRNVILQAVVELRLTSRYIERLALWDHRGKTSGRCVVCEVEERWARDERAKQGKTT